MLNVTAKSNRFKGLFSRLLVISCFELHLQLTYVPNILTKSVERLLSCKYINKYKFYIKLNKSQNRVLQVRICALFTLPCLGAAVRAAAIANFFQRNSLIIPESSLLHARKRSHRLILCNQSITNL